MPWLRKAKLHELEGELAKARGQAPQGARNVDDLVDMVTRARGDGGDVDLDQLGRALARPDEWNRAKFGPSWPLGPDFLNVPGETGQPDPRIWQYPVSSNLRYFSD